MDGSVSPDGVNAKGDGVAPPQGEDPPEHQVLGCGNGGAGDGLGISPVRQNPIPLQNKSQGA